MRIDEKFIHQLSAMFTCRDGKGGELSSLASKMLYKPPGAVYRELKQQTFSAQRRQPEVSLTSDSRFPPLWLAVATRCVENVRFFFSSLPERQVFSLLLIHCFKIVPVCFSQDGRQTTQTNVSFLSYFVFIQSRCMNDRQILQLFFIMKGAGLFYE